MIPPDTSDDRTHGTTSTAGPSDNRRRSISAWELGRIAARLNAIGDDFSKAFHRVAELLSGKHGLSIEELGRRFRRIGLDVSVSSSSRVNRSRRGWRALASQRRLVRTRPGRPTSIPRRLGQR
jgi:hypothetical protein